MHMYTKLPYYNWFQNVINRKSYFHDHVKVFAQIAKGF